MDEDLKILILTKVPTYQTEIKSRRNKSKLNKKTGKFEKDYRKRSWVDFKAVGELFRTVQRFKDYLHARKGHNTINGGRSFIVYEWKCFRNISGNNNFITPMEYYEASSITWKTDLGVTSEKQTSIDLAEDLYQIKLKDYLPKGKVDDIAEALLLSFYGLRQHFNKKRRRNKWQN